MEMTEEIRYYELLEGDENAPETQYELGLCYLYGKGTEQNGAEADKWLRRAAEQGYRPAIALLGSAKQEPESTETGVTEENLPDWCLRAEEGDAEAQYQVACYFIHEQTEGAEKDSIRFLKSAAGQGHPRACYELGLRRLKAEDADEGIKMLRNAADCGLAEASEQLGVCYSRGIGVERDPAEAERRFEDAARLGNAEDKLALAVRLGAGDGVEKSLGKAMRWLKEAQDAGMEDARARYDKAVREASERIAAAEHEAETQRRAQEAARAAEEARRAQEQERRRQEQAAEQERIRREQERRRRAQEEEAKRQRKEMKKQERRERRAKRRKRLKVWLLILLLLAAGGYASRPANREKIKDTVETLKSEAYRAVQKYLKPDDAQIVEEQIEPTGQPETSEAAQERLEPEDVQVSEEQIEPTGQSETNEAAQEQSKPDDIRVGGVHIVLDGQEYNPTDKNGDVVEPIIYEGTVYLPAGAMAKAIGKASCWDGPSYTLYLGSMDGQLERPTVMLKDMTNIGKTITEVKNALTDNYGNKYTTAFYNAKGSDIEYLTDMKYSHLKGTLYVPEGENNTGSCYMEIKADGAVIYTSPEFVRSSRPVQVDVNITGYNDIQVLFSSYSSELNEYGADWSDQFYIMVPWNRTTGVQKNVNMV